MLSTTAISGGIDKFPTTVVPFTPVVAAPPPLNRRPTTQPVTGSSDNPTTGVPFGHWGQGGEANPGSPLPRDPLMIDGGGGSAPTPPARVPDLPGKFGGGGGGGGGSGPTITVNVPPSLAPDAQGPTTLPTVTTWGNAVSSHWQLAAAIALAVVILLAIRSRR